ncbi:MAG: HAD family hydrolase [Microcystaceae cyanobacterium]
MSTYPPALLALDFDGVICDGLIEYFQTSKRTYDQIWNANSLTSIDSLATSFYKLRPVIETGWEMPILLRALVLGISEAKILQAWPAVATEIIEVEKLDRKEISQKLDIVRDEWIDSDLEGWLELHRFYPDIIDRLSQILNSQTKVYIITTKEGRFVKRLLHDQGIELADQFLFGKEYKRPKYETLRLLIKANLVDSVNIWFVEDRLEALRLVQQQPDLKGVKLYLAAWGYNTQQIRDSISGDQNICLLSLQQFNQDFPVWI